ncbi:CobW family GTP-binding protein [Anaeromicropila populeti]|uniref:GTPase, G3E family n=1 Tax=Anaeromicropila populeti TaxID=37658 RepID=A0A1I6JT15_9FIRM|nr:CobW family GTP-binding protein [Anaeromicropila populeti]SFR82097.1 GTPase, G3E family [Anaeromicropila populeti]
MTKINIISGFLGAGKTTLIKKLLKEVYQGEKVVLIENEFGEIGIDGGFLKDAGIQITEMNSGCICCSLVGDFGRALKDVMEQFSPDRIIIEPSGVGKLSDVVKAVKDVQFDSTVELDSYVTVADANKCKMYMKNFGEFFNNQVEYATTIILSRTKNIKQEKLEEVVKLIREHNKEATIITTDWEQITGTQIVAAMKKDNSLVDELLKASDICPECGHHHEHHHEHAHGHEEKECSCHEHEEHHHDHHHHDGEECSCHHHDHHHHHADEVFTSWGKETPHKFEKTEVENALKALSETDEYGTILRAKGMVSGADGNWIYFDLVPGEYELREGAPEYTGRLCVIGTNLSEEKLEKLFHIS